MKTLDLSKTPERTAVAEAVKVLRSGGLVIYPTETVYGIGVDATNQAAVDKLLAYKTRREGKPLSIAVTNQEMAAEYVSLSDQAKTLYKQFLPGPVTVISQSLGKVAVGVASEFNTLGIRIPDYPLITHIVTTLQKPITATSANASGKKRPYTIDDIMARLSDKQKSLIDLVLDAGTLPPNLPSTVIDTTLSTPLFMRQGSVLTPTDSQRNTTTEYESHSDQETMDLAGKIALKYYNNLKKTGLVIGLDGELGAGKTIFTKGIGRFLRITETISSPTYNYCIEYKYQRDQQTGFLHHGDAWKIDSAEAYQLLELPSLAQPGNILVIEWWSQIANHLTKDLKAEIPLVLIAVADKGGNHRTITITEPT